MWHARDAAAPAKVLARASIAAAGSAYQQGISLASGLIVARVIGAADYGIFNLARGLIDLTGILTRLGLDVGLQRYFGETRTREDQALRLAVLHRLRLLATSLALVPIAAVALGIGRLLEAHVYVHAGFADTLLWLAVALPFTTDIAVLGGAYRGILKLTPSVLTESVLLPTIRLALIVILFVAGWRLWAVALGTTLGTLFASGYLALRARSDFPRGSIAVTGAWRAVLQVARYSSVLAMGVLVLTLTSTLDVLFLGHFVTAEALGQYSATKMLLLLTGVFGGAFNQTLGSLVAAHHARGDRDGMLNSIRSATRWIALGTVPLVLVLAVWGTSLLPLLGHSFRTTTGVVCWLAAGQLLFLVLGSTGWALSMTGRHVLELSLPVVGLVLATLGCVVAIPRYGPLGAAIATSSSMAATNALRAPFIRKHFGALPFGADVVAILVVGVATALACRGTLALVSLPPFAVTALGIASFVAVYSALIWTLLMRGSEKDAVRGVLTAALRSANAPREVRT